MEVSSPRGPGAVGANWNDSTNSIPLVRDLVFHLTEGIQEVVLEWMSVATITRNENALKTLMQRWQTFGTPSWRKVATVAASVLAASMGYHVMFGQNGLTAYEQKRQETRSLDHQLQTLQRENELLKGHVDRLQSDPNAIEQQAREGLHYTRAGEVIYSLEDAPANKAVAAQQ